MEAKVAQMTKPRRVAKPKPRMRAKPAAKPKPRLKAREKTKEERAARWAELKAKAPRQHCDWCDRDDVPIMILVVDRRDDPRVWGFWLCYDCNWSEIEREADQPKKWDRIDSVCRRLRWRLAGKKTPKETKAAMAKVRAACWGSDAELARWERKLKEGKGD